ncbi:MerR family transcriptional regulator [Pseudolysinimonas sp.]|uniref:MerR family transcriptional regulator n=1 Tax=Pseudolysinimonas sp. TaxID=2680009 RepID=UPI003F80FC64
MHIGEVAERTSLSHRTLRHYDEIGLVRPSGRTDGGFRLYTETDVSRLLLIRRMKPLGFSLEEMADFLTVVGRLQTDPADRTARVRLDALIAETRVRRQRLRAQLDMADEFQQLLTSL